MAIDGFVVGDIAIEELEHSMVDEPDTDSGSEIDSNDEDGGQCF